MAPLTTFSVMVSLALWLLWNCRPALYSWGLRGDKRPFNSERREVTEKEALREGYQSDIHHTNLSLGTGPARARPWRWSWACMCVWACGVGVKLHARNGGCRGGRRWGEEPDCPGVTAQSGEEWSIDAGGWIWGWICVPDLSHLSHLSVHLFQILSIPSFSPFMASYQLKVHQQPPQMRMKNQNLRSSRRLRRFCRSSYWSAPWLRALGYCVFKLLSLQHVYCNIKGLRWRERVGDVLLQMYFMKVLK